MAQWVDRYFRRAREASSDAELEQVRREFEGELPPSLINGGSHRTNDLGLSLGDGDEGGSHIHLHLGGQGGVPQQDQGGGAVPMQQPAMQPQTTDQPPMNGPAPPNAGSNGDPETRIAALEAAVATLTQKLSELMDGGEENVQLENPDTKDARSYIMRRGGKIKKVGDEELPVPDRTPEMMGETDLPGIQDLNYNGESNSEMVKNVTATGDSFNMESIWQDTMAKAEIIVPGIRVPTFDGRVSTEVTTRRLCSFRRQTLDAAIDDSNLKDLVASLTDIKNHNQIKNMTCDSTRMAFNVIAGAIGGQRNTNFVRSGVNDGARQQQQNKGAPSLAEIQRRNKEAWKTGEFKRPSIN
jgi:hypothetical protein